MLGGSGSALKDGMFWGVCFSPVNVNVPDSLRNSVRAVIPYGCPATLGGQFLSS